MNGVNETSNNNIRPQSRIRRDKSRSSSKLKWNEVSTIQDVAPIQTPSLKIEDYEPGYALRKIALIYEKNQNEEVASLIEKLSNSTLSKIFPEFPIDMFIEGIPHTLCIINSLYSRVFSEKPNNFPKDKLPFGSLITQIVKLYARSMQTDMPKLKQWDKMRGQCKNLLKIAGYVDGIGALKMLRHRRRCLDRALESLGEHGLVEVEISPIGVEEIHSDLMPMTSALRVEMDRMIANCKSSMQKLNRTARTLYHSDSDVPTNTISKKVNVGLDLNKSDRISNTVEVPLECNHQRMLQYTTTNIQDRLYKNKAILNVIEPTMNYAQLPRLVSTLQDRIECDKDLLLTFSQLRKEMITIPADVKLAPSLNHYSKAFDAVIDILKEFVSDDPGTPETFSVSARSDTGSNLSPNKSKGSSLASLSQNSLFDENANERPQINNTSASLDSHSNDTLKASNNAPGYEAVALLQRECDKLRHELHRAQKSIDRLRSRENELVKRLSKQAQNSFDGGSGTFEDLSAGQARPSELALSFRNLYSDGRLQALDALDEVCQTDGDNIKSKLLFSVMVLSFRSCNDTLDNIRHTLHEVMCSSRVASIGKQEGAVREVEKVFNLYLKKTTNHYDISKNIQDVFNQICDALYDRPHLIKSIALRSYVKECVQLSWSITVQTPPLFLEYDATTFDPLKHDRFHTSDRSSNRIVSYIWPSLLERQSAKCVAKGIVITGV